MGATDAYAPPLWGPVVHIPFEEYKESLKPWKKALIIKLLGKKLSFRVMRQRLDSLWHLQWGCQLIDLEEDFFIVRFYSPEDYRYVLDNGP